MKVGHAANRRVSSRLESGREFSTDWKAAAAKASRSAKWAITMTKWLITKVKGKTTWRLVTFCGPNGGESVGIVDLVAIRKNHNRPTNGLKRGDLFEIMLIQVKGGKSAWPSTDDILRLRRVGQQYRAKEILLAEWKKGKQPTIYRMKRAHRRNGDRRSVWEKVELVPLLFR